MLKRDRRSLAPKGARMMREVNRPQLKCPLEKKSAAARMSDTTSMVFSTKLVSKNRDNFTGGRL